MLEGVEQILAKNSEFASVGSPCPEADILRAEQTLAVKFPLAFREYLLRWGWISFGPMEYFGVNTSICNVVTYTLDERSRAGLPHALIVICDHDGDEHVCLDTEQPDGTDCKVVIWDIPTGSVSRIRAASFEAFLESDMTAFVG